MSNNISRRLLLKAGGATSAVLILGPGAGLMAANASSDGPLSRAFAHPGAALRPRMYWMLPTAAMTDAEVAIEIQAMARAGVGGAEIVPFAVSGVAPGQHGWGSGEWNARVEAALNAATTQRMTIDLAVGPMWPAAVPSINTDSAGAARELVPGFTAVAGGTTFNGPLPQPIDVPLSPPFGGPPRTPGPQQLVAATAACVAAGSSLAAKPVLLDPASLIDLTGRVSNGNLNWTAPTAGQWVVFAFWHRTTGQVVSGATATPAYVVDHFGNAGTGALTGYWETNLLTPALRTLLRRTGGALVEDSLELEAALHWTQDLSARFASGRGYSLTPYLPVLYIAGLHRFAGRGVPTNPDSPADFDLPDGLGARIRNDYYQTLTDLFAQRHLTALRVWANGLGLRMQAQPGYGVAMDMSAVAISVDVPMVEQFYFGDTIDAYRTLAGVAHLAGKEVLSTEVAPVVSYPTQDAYGTTWPRLLEIIHQNYAGGVNQAVLHEYPHATAPGASWPGWSPFDSPYFPGFAEAWGPRQPGWRHMPDLTGALAREQFVLRSGVARIDVAVYRHSYWEHGYNVLWTDQGLTQAGYSYDFVAPALLALPSATVVGRRLAAAGPGYRALILNNQRTLSLDTARRILRHARSGLTVIVVGDPPTSTPSFANAASQDEALRTVVAELLTVFTVVRVATEAEVPTALAARGVLPAAQFTTPAPVLSVHRAEGHVDYWFFFNQSSAEVDTQVTLAGGGRPYLLDPWTGAVVPAVHYARAGNSQVTVPLRLRPHQTALIVQTDGHEFGWFDSSPAVRSTEIELAWAGDGPVARATQAGTYTVTWQSGETRRVVAPAIPAPRTLTNWQLAVEDWQPGTATESTIINHNLTLSALVPWLAIPELQDVSGIGRYTTTLTLAAAETLARLDLGEVAGTVRVTVNGRPAPVVDLNAPVLDLRGLLRVGSNLIEVEVATNLRNRMRVVRPIHAMTAPQPYGLLGPVRFQPYVDLPLS